MTSQTVWLTTDLRTVFLGLALLTNLWVLLPSAQAQERPDAVQQAMMAMTASHGQRTALPLVTVLERLRATNGIDESSVAFISQLEATGLAELGEYEPALERFPEKLLPLLRTQNAPGPGYTPRSAAETIARLAEGRRIVVINEAHHAPQTRTLLVELLPLLRGEGFTDYAAEALSEHAEKIGPRGYAEHDDGLYSREAVFGQVLSTAAQLGFRIQNYEYQGKQRTQQDRETGQARNLARLLRERPDARFIVHAGYSHAIERALPNYTPMAAELKRLTGLDPLTVDQTFLRPLRPATDEEAIYRQLLERLPGDTATASVFVSEDGAVWSYQPDGFDVTVVLPDPPALHGRPGWLWQPALKRHHAPVDRKLCANTWPCAVISRRANRPENAVAADGVVLREPDACIVLALPAGRFTLVATDAQDRVLGMQEITVPASPNDGPQPVR
ncbi:hypothetical protein [Pseudoxanthomonas composti]|uniref:Erythromycin esterase family protein n=1 Tax=Pseudoxanthomonas composti TaxID=2137479 RepID=A0A4Q1JXD9_9GAMM|nr:hypothetical protein [Pseudoxanthomonas composti]RXR07295.1 hypothetical protein EPA99_05095 [Pseudoxanthomonas composti]